MSARKNRKRAVCTSCGHKKPCDLHHPAREAAAPAMVVPECPADHRVLSRRQERAGMYRGSEPRSEIERVRWILVGALDTVGRMRGRDEEFDRRLSRMGKLMATFGDMALGLLDVAGDPNEAFGPDPIRRTPRTFRGARPMRRPEWRAANEPPEGSDLERSRALFQMAHEMELEVFGEDKLGIGGIDVGQLLARFAELEEDCSLCPLVLLVEDVSELFDRAVRARSVAELVRLARSLGRFRLLCDRVIALIVELAMAETADEARDRLEGFFAWYLKAGRLLGETPGDESESATGGSAGLHRQEESRD